MRYRDEDETAGDRPRHAKYPQHWRLSLDKQQHILAEFERRFAALRPGNEQ